MPVWPTLAILLQKASSPLEAAVHFQICLGLMTVQASQLSINCEACTVPYLPTLTSIPSMATPVMQVMGSLSPSLNFNVFSGLVFPLQP